MGAVSRIAILAIVIGVVARFAFLDAPLFFRDEAITGLFATGHDYREYNRLFDGRIHAVREILATTELDPARGPGDVVRLLAMEDPHHAPLFYVLERCWIGIFGTSISALRSFPALLGVLGIGLTYLLIRELRGAQAARIGAALFALSPFFVSLSREAREYELLVDIALLATFVLARALRNGSFVSWALYALGASVGLYTDSLFAVLLPAHLIMTLAANGHRKTNVVCWTSACAASIALFAPWALNALHSGSRIAHELDWVRVPYSFGYSALKWIFNLGALSFDGEFGSLRYGAVGALAAAASVAAVALAARRFREPLNLAALALTGVPVVAFVTLDVFEHAHFATVTRYMCIAWIGVLLALTAAICDLLERSRAGWAFGSWIALLALGTASFAIRGPAENWWNNTDDVSYQSLAREIRSREPIVTLIEDRDQIALELARYLSPGDRVLLVRSAADRIRVAVPALVVEPTIELLVQLGREHYRRTLVPIDFRSVHMTAARRVLYVVTGYRKLGTTDRSVARCSSESACSPTATTSKSSR